MSVLFTALDLRPTLRLFLFIVGVVVLCEVGVMFVLPLLLPERPGAVMEALSDAALLSAACSLIILPVMMRLRRRAENAERAINVTDDGYWVVNRDGRFLEVNDGYCRLIGHGREALLKMGIADVDANGRPELVSEHIERVLQRGQDRFEMRHRHRDGHAVELEVSGVRVDAATMVFFLRDITDRKRTASKIHNLAF